MVLLFSLHTVALVYQCGDHSQMAESQFTILTQELKRMHYMDANKTAGEVTRWQLHKNAACNPEQVLAATPHKTPTVRPPAPYHENYSS